MKNKETYSPAKRFPEFSHDKWISCRLSDIGQVLNGLSGKTAEDFGKGYLYVTYKQVFDGTTINLNECERVKISPNEKQNKLFSGDILVTITSETREDIGSVSVIDLPKIPTVYLNSFCIIYRLTDKTQTPPTFILQLLQTTHLRQQIKNIAQGFIRVNISRINFLDLNIRIPSQKHECIKIAKCLSVIDSQIELQHKKIETLKKHKQSLMQQLFPQRSSDTPILRFTKKNTRWKYKPLKAKVAHCTRKNATGTETIVLTNSALYGVICQQDYFERDIVSQYNLKNYYVVEKGDYVYNPRVSVAAPVGPVSKNTLSRGVISPLYMVFRFNQETDDFYVYYFQSLHWQIHLKRIANSGARFDRMSISTSDFFDIKVPDLPAEESQKIASTLTSLDNLIDAYQKKYDLLIKHKSGLMQQLFPN